jgi:hypothetical protein
MSDQLELDLPWPYTFTPPLAVRQLSPGLDLVEVLLLTKKGEAWSYEPKTGLLTIHHPIKER